MDGLHVRPEQPLEYPQPDQPEHPGEHDRGLCGGSNLKALFGDTGLGGPGGYGASGSAAWLSDVGGRGQAGALASPATDFGPWGGSVTFDDAQTNWSFVGTGGTPGPGQVDFLPVAIHELGHVLGIGDAGSWPTYVDSKDHLFTGPHASASYGSAVPLYPGGVAGEPTPDNHWATGLLSFGLTPIMEIDAGNGATRQFTSLDWAGLADIGWSIDAPSVTGEPPSLVTVGAGFGLTVAIEDPDGHLDTTFTGPVTLSLASNPAGATLGGTLTMNAVHGLATFSGLSLNKAGAGATIAASAADFPSTTTSAIAATPLGQATKLVVTTPPPSSVQAGSGFGLTAQAEDSFGTLDPTFAGTVSLGLGANPGNDAIAGTVSAVASGGKATFSGLSLVKAAPGYAISASATGGLSPGASSPFAVTPAPASSLVVSAGPPSSVLAGNDFALTVSADDPFGNLDTNFAGTVSLALASNPAGATLGGTLSRKAAGGIASFPGLTLDATGAGFTIGATAPGLSGTTTGAVSVVSSLAPSISILFDDSHDTSGFFAANPAAKTVLEEAGQILGSQLHDALAAIVPSGGNSWSVSLLDPSHPTSGTGLTIDNPTIPANTIVIDVGGFTSTPGVFSTFWGLPGYSYQGSTEWGNLIASRGQSGALASPATDFGPFGGAIAFGSGTNWSFSGTGGTPGPGQYDFLTAALEDLGNLLGIGTAASWAAQVNGSHQLTGPHAEAANSGAPVPLASSNTFFASGLLSNGNEPAMDGAISTGSRKAFTSLDWAALQDVGWTIDNLVVTAQPPPTISAPGTGFGLTVSAEDPTGHLDPTFQGTITLALGHNPSGASLGGTVSVKAIHGQASFSGLTLDQAGQGVTILAGNATLGATVTTAPFAVTSPSAATHLVVTSQPPSSVASGSGFGLMVSAEDGSNHVDPNYSGPVTIALANDPASGSLGGTLTAMASHGVATFAGLSLDKAAPGYSLSATAAGLASATSSAITVTSAAASQLVVTLQPPSSLASNGSFGLTISAEDAAGNVDPNFVGTVSLALATGPTGASLGGTLMAMASAGSATFAGLSLDKAGSGYSLQATASGLASATTASFVVTPSLVASQALLSAIPATPSYGDPVHFTATVSPRTGGGTPTGTVQFAIDGSPFGPAETIVAGVATSPTVASLAAGPHTISASYSGDPGFSGSNALDLPLSVALAPLTITANSATKGYGTVNPAFSASYSGFVNGQGPADLTGSPSFQTPASSGSHAGDYPISVSGFSSKNYAITFRSGTLSVTPAPLAIVADSQAKTYGAANPSPTESFVGFVGSDSAASLASPPIVTTPATPASHAGSYPIAVSGASSSDYAITYQDSTLTITPAPLTISADSKNRPYGAPNPPLTASYSGFVNGDSPASLSTPATLSTTATAASHVGSYPISVSGGSSGDYSITFAPGTLRITPAPLTIAAGDSTKPYGSALPPLSATYSGLVDGDTAASLSAPVALATSATAASHVGAYPITASGATSADYAITFAPGTLRVTPAPLTISADAASGVSGSALPALAASYFGFVNGDGPASLATPAIASTSASPASPAGSYPIEVGGASSPDYVITYQPGVLTLQAAITTPPAAPPPVIVSGLQVTRAKKAIGAIVVQFSGDVNAASAGAFSIVSGKKVKKKGIVYTKNVPIASASYDPATHRLSLSLKKAVPATTPLQLTIRSGAVTDASGRAIDGNRDGQAGGDFVAQFGAGGLSLAAPSVAVDALLASGLRSHRGAGSVRR